MIIEGELPEQVAEADGAPRYVIVGAGPVGIYLAYLLSKAGQSLIVIEAGGRIVDSSRNDVAARSVGNTFVGHSLGRAFGLGGTSVLWGGQLAEFEPEDFATWPVAFDEIERLYGKVYRDLGIIPQQQDNYRARMGGETQAAANIERVITHWLPQQNFSKIFRKEVAENPNIPVILNCTVNGVEFDGDRATAVTVQSLNGEIKRISGSSFIFCNGTLEIIRLFLSTARDKQVPWRNNTAIGQCFQDHPCAKAATAEIVDERRFRDYFENAIASKGVKLHPKLRVRSDRRTAGDIGVSGFFVFRSDIQENIGNIKWLLRSMHSGIQVTSLRTLPRDILTLIRVFAPIATRFIQNRRIMAFFDRSVDFMVQGEQRSAVNSQIRLTDEPHPVPGLHGIEIDWQVDARELVHAVHDFTAMVDEYLQSKNIAKLVIEQKVAACDPSFVSTMPDVYHHAGGMCMSAAPQTGVVDTNCQVWGTTNVYIGGASTFPSSSHANTTFTALALVHRLADYLVAKAHQESSAGQ